MTSFLDTIILLAASTSFGTSVEHHRKAPEPYHRGIPVGHDIDGDATDFNKALYAEIFWALGRSKMVTFNVDSPVALEATVSEVGSTKGRKELAVTYAWRDKVVYETRIRCSASTVKVCADRVVKGAIRASRSVDWWNDLNEVVLRPTVS